MSNMPAPLPMARLSCGHYQRVTVPDARRHGVVMCLTCHREGRPNIVLMKEWHVHCRDCGWSRWAGQLKWEARKLKERHVSGTTWDHFVAVDYATLPGMEYTELISPTTPPKDDHDDRNDRPQLF